MKKGTNKKGFTLVELLAVIVILVVIMIVALPNFSSSIDRNNEKHNIKIEKALLSSGELYIQNNIEDVSVENVSNKEYCYFGVLELSANEYLSIDDVVDYSEGCIIFNKTDNVYKISKSSSDNSCAIDDVTISKKCLNVDEDGKLTSIKLNLRVEDAKKYSKNKKATIEVSDSSVSGLKDQDIVIKYDWSLKDVSCSDMKNTVVIKANKGDKKVSSSIEINNGTGKGKLYICNQEDIYSDDGNYLNNGYVIGKDMYLDNEGAVVSDILVVNNVFPSKDYSSVNNISVNGNVIKITGEDPYIIYNGLQIKDIEKVIVKFNSAVSDDFYFQVFWAVSGGGFVNSQETKRILVRKGVVYLEIDLTDNDNYTVSARPTNRVITGIRFDFGDKANIDYNVDGIDFVGKSANLEKYVYANLSDKDSKLGYYGVSSGEIDDSKLTSINGESYRIRSKIDTLGVSYIYVKDKAGNITKSEFNSLDKLDKPTDSLCKKLIYNGKEQTLVDDSNFVGYTLSNYKQINAGIYNITAKLENGFVWKDGSSGEVSFSCSIDKAIIGGGSVEIIGDNIVGSVLAAKVTDTSPKASYKYRWYVNTNNSSSGGTIINGAVDKTYTITDDQFGKYVYVVVTASLDNYNDISFSNISKKIGRKYNIEYVLNGGTSGSSVPISVDYDSIINISNPTRRGYTFLGWTFNGNTSVAKYGTSKNNVATSWNSTSTTVTAEYFKNLTDKSSGTVTMTANWMKNNYQLYDSSNNSLGYADTLSRAVFYTNSNGTIKVLEHNESSGAIIDKNIILDLNGKTITLTNSITNSSNYTLKIKGNGTITSSSNILIINKGIMTLEDATISYTGAIGSDVGGLPVIDNQGDFTISSGNIISTDLGIRTTGNSVTISGGTIDAYLRGLFIQSGTITMTGGTINANVYGMTTSKVTSVVTLNVSGGTINILEGITDKDVSNNTAGILVYGSSDENRTILNYSDNAYINSKTQSTALTVVDYGEAYIKGGRITAYGGIHLSSGLVEVSGGTITCDNVVAFLSGGTLLITGGELTAPTGVMIAKGTVNVSGGTITSSDKGIDSNKSVGDVSINISGGKIIQLGNSQDGAAIYENPYRNETTTYKQTISITGGTINATGYGVVVREGSTATMTGGSITAEGNKPTILYDGTLTLGINEGSVSTTSPKIYNTGNTSNILDGTGTWNFYDGVLYGKNIYKSEPNSIPTGFSVEKFADSTYGNKVILIGEYTITYNANGGSGAPSSQTKDFGKDLILSSTIPTRSGYKFLGWSKDKKATSATWSVGGTYTVNTSVILYAVWKRNS